MYNHSIEVKEIKNKQEFVKTIDNLYAGGGTNFYCAFFEIKKRIRMDQANINLSEATIIFMTDGQDNYAHPDKAAQYL